MPISEKRGSLFGVVLTDEEAVSSKWRLLRSISRLPKMLYLFQRSDLKPFTLPGVMFGILGALSGSILTTNESPDPLAIFWRTPLVLAWAYFSCLVFNFSNQRAPASVIEDSFNKPWRPIPSKMITPTQTRRFLLASVPLLLAFGYCAGVEQETALVCVLSWMLCDLEGGNEHYTIRNALTAACFAVFLEGTLRLACGPVHMPSHEGYAWIGVVSLIILTTVHVSDYYDFEGDAQKGRRTIPVAYQPLMARLMFAVPMGFWLIFLPIYWNISIFGWVLCTGLGSLVVFRLLTLRGQKEDKRTYELWGLWVVGLYVLPIIKSQTRVLEMMPL